MSVGRRRQWRIAICYRIVTQQVCVNGGAVVAAADIHKGAITDRKRSAGGKWERRLYRPAASELFIGIDRNARSRVSAWGDDAGVIYRCSVEPDPVHVHVWSAAPTVGNRIVDLGNSRSRWEWGSASEYVEFPLINGAASS